MKQKSTFRERFASSPAPILSAGRGASFGALLTLALASAPAEAGLGQQAISATGIEAGLCVQVGATEASALLEAAKDKRFMVHGLVSDLPGLASIRAAILAEGKYGQVAVEKAEGFAALPYGDNLVNLLIADLDQLGAKAPSDKEIERVVVPDGAAYVKKGGSWSVRRKARPDQYGTWTHFFADPEGTAASDDSAIGVSTTIKWIGNHQWGATGGETESMTQYRIDKNVVIYVFPKGNGRGHVLVARDAFNGITLWHRDDPAAAGQELRWRFVMDKNRLFLFDKVDGYAVSIDGRTGKTLREYTNGLRMSSKYQKRGSYPAVLAAGNGNLVQSDGSQVAVLDIETGALKWKYTAPNGLWVQRTGLSRADNKVFFLEVSAPAWGHPYENLTYSRWPMVDSVRAITVLDVNGGGTPLLRKELDKIPAYNGCLVNDAGPAYDAHYPKAQQLTYHKGRLILASTGGHPAYIKVFDLTGREIWSQLFHGHEHNRANSGLLVAIARGDTVWAASSPSAMAFNLADGAHDSVPVRFAKSSPCHLPKLYFYAHHNGRCTRPTASKNMMLIGFSTFLDRKGNWAFVNASRSHCGGGIYLANGMSHFTTHNCNCLGRSLSGYMAQRFEPVPPPAPDETRRTVTAALPPKQSLTQPPLDAGELGKDWTIEWNNSSYYNMETVCNPKGGGPGIAVPTICTPGKGATVPVGAYKFTVSLNEHRVECSNGTGRLWSFIADGRISRHPLLVGDLAVFGSHDGYVYAVKASDGTPVWRFMAAPAVKKMMAHGQLESCWPVFGVELKNGKVVFSAGRHPAMDGGIHAYGLDPVTGEMAWKKTVRTEVLLYPHSVAPTADIRNPAFNTDSLASTGIDPANPQDKVFRTNRNTEAGTPVVALPAITLGLREDRRNGAFADPSGRIRFQPVGYRGGAYVFRVFSPGAHTVSLFSAGGRREFATTSEGDATYEISRRMLKAGRYVARITDKSGRQAVFKLVLGD